MPGSSRPFMDFLREQRSGGLHDQLSDELQALVATCVDLDKPGKLVLTLTVQPKGDVLMGSTTSPPSRRRRSPARRSSSRRRTTTSSAPTRGSRRSNCAPFPPIPPASARPHEMTETHTGFQPIIDAARKGVERRVQVVNG